MDEFNPYAPPKSELDQGPLLDHANVAWRDGKLLMVRKDAVLPDRCLKCNKPSDGYPFQRSLSWASPYYALLLLLSPLLYLVALLLVSKRGKVTVGICRVHRKKRRHIIVAGWLTALVGFGAFFLAATVPEGWVPGLLIAGLFLLVAGTIGGVFGSRFLVTQRIDKHFIWLSKISPAYLATFPDVKG